MHTISLIFSLESNPGKLGRLGLGSFSIMEAAVVDLARRPDLTIKGTVISGSISAYFSLYLIDSISLLAYNISVAKINFKLLKFNLNED